MWGCIGGYEEPGAACSAAALPHGADKTPRQAEKPLDHHHSFPQVHVLPASLRAAVVSPIPYAGKGWQCLPCDQGSVKLDPRDAAKGRSCLFGCLGCRSQLLDCCGVWRPGVVPSSCSPAALQATESGCTRQRVFLLIFKSKDESERARPHSEDSLCGATLWGGWRQSFPEFVGWQKQGGNLSQLSTLWLHPRASLPPSVCRGFLIAFLTLLYFFCWQCPEARSPPGALALAC